MAKIRVYELARELKMESKVLLAKMKTLGIHVPSHQSTLTAAQVDKIRASQQGDKPKVVLRRRRKASPSAESKQEEAVESAKPSSAAKDEKPASHSDIRIEVDKDRLAEVEAEVQAKALQVKEEADAKAKVEASNRAKLEEEERAKAESEAKATMKAIADAKSDEDVAQAVKEIKPKAADPSTLESQLDVENSPVEGAEAGQRKAKASKSSKKEASASAEDAVDKASKPKRKSFSGATIVRRATPEETLAMKAKEEARLRTSRREDSRGVRVTGIGVSTRMGDTPSDSSKDAKKSSMKSGGSKKDASSVQAAMDVSESSPRWSDRKDHYKVQKKDDEERARPVVSGGQKKRLSTRDLLSVDDDFEGSESSANRKRKHIYTPNAAARRKDYRRRKDLKSTQITTPRAAYRVVKMERDEITVGDLAKQLSVKAGELIKKLMGQGVMATVNQSIDFETASLMCSDYGFECKNVAKTVEDVLLVSTGDDSKFDQTIRPPIITVMGHVDHGKTSILDAIRKSDVASGESGGITQHIGAYTVEKDGNKFAFLDTPGHAAFSAMRSRGAQLTDIVVLVVAADDGVMPQTVEAISHARSSEVPMIVAVNKVDKQNVNFDKIYTELSEQGVQAEEWGGDVQFVKVSALKNQGIGELLEAIQLQAEVLELKTRFEGDAEAVVVEAHLDKGRGPIATVMVTKGSLSIGQVVVAGTVTGKIRAMTDHNGKSLKKAGPSTPVQIIGLTAVPMSGDMVNRVADEKAAKEVAQIRQSEILGAASKTSAASSLDDLLGKVNQAEIPSVPLVVKADTQGTVEAVVSVLNKLNSDRVKNVIVHKAVGGINESDVSLAETSGAVILGFNVRSPSNLFDSADKRGVVIKFYSIIYELVDAVKNLMAGELPPICTEVIQGHAEVRNAISVPKIGVIAGSSVTDGKITRSSLLRLIRDEIVIFDGKVGSLRRFKDDVKEVQNGYECGISIDGYTDIKVGDVIEAYMIEEKAATYEVES